MFGSDDSFPFNSFNMVPFQSQYIISVHFFGEDHTLFLGQSGLQGSPCPSLHHVPWDEVFDIWDADSTTKPAEAARVEFVGPGGLGFS